MKNYIDLITRQIVSEDQLLREYRANKERCWEDTGTNNFRDYIKVCSNKQGFLRLAN